MFEVLETCKKVAEQSLRVQIDKQALVQWARTLLKQGIEPPQWERRYHFYEGSERTVGYLLVLDTLNFCFWAAPGNLKWGIRYGPGKLSGYYALALSLKQALERGIPLTDAKYLSELTLDRFKRVLGGEGELQLLEERLNSLNALGKVLLEEYQGEAVSLVEAAGQSAIALVRMLYRRLPSYRDVAKYGGHQVFFYKRAQIIAADLHGAFQGQKWGRFTDMEKLTAFADYKLPQVLRHLKILRYYDELAEKVDRKSLLEPGGPEEVEIRANTVWAVELIRQELQAMGKDLKAFEIDWILWNMGQDVAFKKRPYHRTVTIFY